jgi:excisionase family DNA binding protein
MEEYTETLTTAQMAERAGVTQRTVQRWLKCGELHATVLRGGQYIINPLDLVELSLPIRADATPKEKRLSYDELFDTFLEVRLDQEDVLYRLNQAEENIERLTRRVADLAKSGQPKKTAAPRRKRDTRKRLPWGYEPVSIFTRMHGIPSSTVAKAMKEQAIYAERGNWKWANTTIKQAFDDDECRLFYEHFHTHPKFTPCDDCPH